MTVTDQKRCQCRTSQGCANCHTPQDRDDLPAARTRLENAVSAAIDPRPQWVQDRTRWLDALYDQLTDAQGEQARRGAGVAGDITPVWLDAVDLLREIDRVTITWEPRRHLYPYMPAVNTPMRLQIVEKRAWRPQDATFMDLLSAWLEGWTKRVEKLFTAEPVKHLVSPCPACGTRWVYREDTGETGKPERVRQPALQITTAGCTCQHCHHTWAPEYFTHLARVLGYELPAGVLE